MELKKLGDEICSFLYEKYGVPVSVSIRHHSDSFDLLFMEKETGETIVGMDCKLDWRRMHIYFYSNLLDLSFEYLNEWKRKLQRMFPQFIALTVALKKMNFHLILGINGNEVECEDINFNEDWTSFSLSCYSKSFIHVYDHLNFYFDEIIGPVSVFWGIILSFSSSFSDFLSEKPIHGWKYDGEVKEILSRSYERNPLNRAACIALKGTKCVVCGLDMKTKYGPIGEGFIEVHHVYPLSANDGKGYLIDPKKDLEPVCPNCHAMIHRRVPPYSIQEMKEIISKGEVNG